MFFLFRSSKDRVLLALLSERGSVRVSDSERLQRVHTLFVTFIT